MGAAHLAFDLLLKGVFFNSFLCSTSFQADCLKTLGVSKLKDFDRKHLLNPKAMIGCAEARSASISELELH